MTLTDILPSLRRSIPDPMVRDRWPEFTATSTTDITIAGVSMLRLVDWADRASSTTHDAHVTLRPSSTDASIVRRIELPGDLRQGDLLVVPCLGLTSLHSVRERTRHPERMSDDRVDHDREWFPTTHCDR